MNRHLLDCHMWENDGWHLEVYDAWGRTILALNPTEFEAAEERGDIDDGDIRGSAIDYVIRLHEQKGW